MARVPDVSRRAPRRCFGLVVMRGWPASSEPRGEGRVNHKLAHPYGGQDGGNLPTFKWAGRRPIRAGPLQRRTNANRRRRSLLFLCETRRCPNSEPFGLTTIFKCPNFAKPKAFEPPKGRVPMLGAYRSGDEVRARYERD